MAEEQSARRVLPRAPTHARRTCPRSAGIAAQVKSRVAVTRGGDAVLKKKRKEKKKTTTPQKTKQANKIKFTLLFNPFHFF